MNDRPLPPLGPARRTDGPRRRDRLQRDERRAPLRGPSLPMAVLSILAASGVIAWLAFTGPRAGAVLDVVSETDQGAFARMTVRKTKIGDQERTPTWRELQETFDLRPSEREAAMRAYSLSRSEPVRPDDQIPEGADIVLTVE